MIFEILIIQQVVPIVVTILKVDTSEIQDPGTLVHIKIKGEVIQGIALEVEEVAGEACLAGEEQVAEGIFEMIEKEVKQAKEEVFTEEAFTIIKEEVPMSQEEVEGDIEMTEGQEEGGKIEEHLAIEAIEVQTQPIQKETILN